MNYTKYLEGSFDGWVCDTVNNCLVDDAGNSYSIDEIRAIFYTRQLIANLTGSKGAKLTSLKKHLEDKIRATQLPVVTIEWSDGRKSIVNHSNSRTGDESA